MSTYMQLFYKDDEELQAIALRLQPLLKKVKLLPAKGRYKRAYIHIKSIPIDGKNAYKSMCTSCTTP